MLNLTNLFLGAVFCISLHCKNTKDAENCLHTQVHLAESCLSSEGRVALCSSCCEQRAGTKRKGIPRFNVLACQQDRVAKWHSGRKRAAAVD